MKLTRTTRVIVGIAGALLLAVIGLPDKSSPEDQVAPSFTPGFPGKFQSELTGATQSIEERIDAQRARSLVLAWERNPFAPIMPTALEPIQESPEANSPNNQIEQFDLATLPHLSGIAILSERPIALLDGELVQTGDLLQSGYTVQAIDNRTVTLSKGQQLVTLTLGTNR